jgi:hemerythrin-like domain-containing protein
MEAIEILMSEHRTIEKVIDALRAFTGSVRLGAEDRPELARFVRFIKEYADGHHHAKEEGELFEAMVQAGFPRQAGPIGVMLHEHDLGRQHVAVLAALAEKSGPWSADDCEHLAAAAGGYGDLLRAHIQKEDSVLYPMAEQRLPEALVLQVEAGCARADAEAVASGRRAALEQLGRELVGRHVPGLGENGSRAG